MHGETLKLDGIYKRSIYLDGTDCGLFVSSKQHFMD